MPEYRLTPIARNDLIEIGRYTEKSWGQIQRRKYLQVLHDAFQMIADNPALGRVRVEIRSEVRSLVAGRHVIFYRGSFRHVDILRVLHVRQDPSTAGL